MKYITGTAANQLALLDVIHTFLTSCGFTTNYFGNDTYTYNSGYPETYSGSNRLHVTDGIRWLNFRATSGANISNVYSTSRSYYGIGFNHSTGFTTSNHWDAQPGCPHDSTGTLAISSYLHDNSSSCIYRMFYFSNPFLFLIHLDFGGSIYKQICFGTYVDKYGTWTGGNFFLSSSPHGSSSVDYGFLANYDYSEGGNSNNSSAYLIGGVEISSPLVSSTSNTFITCGGNNVNSSDSRYFPYFGYPNSHTNDQTYQIGEYSMSDAVFQILPTSIACPIILMPVYSGINMYGKTGVSLIGEMPNMKITGVTPNMYYNTYTYGTQKYMLLPIKSSTTSNTYAINTALAVEYEDQ